MKRRPVVPSDTRELQAKAAIPSLSAWVSANAGSGKTHVLAQRVIRLLLAGADPSCILCLTYTRAAAANMSTRVFSNLAAWATLSEEALAKEIAELEGRWPDAERIKLARQLFARALETPGGLKIQTIHAFCEAVLHQFPLEANIAGHFELMDGSMETALVAEARRQMIARAAGDEDRNLAEAFATVLQHGGEAGLDDLLAGIVARREELRRFLAVAGSGAPRLQMLLAEFGLGAEETADRIAADIWPDGYFCETLARNMAARAAAAGKMTAAKFAADLEAACAAHSSTHRLLALRGLLLSRKTGGIWEPKSLRNVLSAGVREHFPDFEAEYVRFAQTVLGACDRMALRTMLDASDAALTLADWLITRYERLKGVRGFLDFNDLITRTAALLVRQDAGAWVQYKLDRGIDHILLDEAQDTSPMQWAVVTALTSEFFAGEGGRDGVVRTVFAVGDEKQSIYSFQGARPESFAITRNEFRTRIKSSGGQFEDLRLQRSFRSTSDVLSAVDLVFADPLNREGLSVDDEPIEHKAIRDSEPGTVEVWPSLGPTQVEEPDDWRVAIDHASAPAVRLANEIARTIRHWLDSGERLDGQGRPLAPGDIMVLVRKRDRFIHALTRELKRLQVPVAGADRLLLTGHIAVQDLLAVARFCLQPQDDLSLAAVLRGPLFGFSDEQLEAVAAHRPTGTSLFRALEAASHDEPDAFSAVEKLQRWRSEVGYGSPFAFFSNLLARDGGRRLFMARLGAGAGDVVDEFLSFCLTAEKTGATEIEALVALLDSAAPEIKREMDQSRGEVRILTAHASKGLEAPLVFLVDSGAAAFSDSHLPRLMPFAAPRKGWPGNGFIWRASADMANSFARDLAAEARRKAEQEYRRLLYVGMTRAEDRLIVCGYHGVRGQPERGWHSMVSNALSASTDTAVVTHAVTDASILRYRVTAISASAARSEQAAAPGWAPSPIPIDLAQPLPPRPRLPRPLAPSGATAVIEPDLALAASGASPVLEPEGQPGLSLQRGTAVHRLLQALPDVAPDDREAAASRYLARIGSSWPAGETEATRASVLRIMNEERFSVLFSARSRAEVAVMGTVSVGGIERAVSGKIDRIVAGDDRVLIVDYKTNRPAPVGLETVPPSHVAQMALYQALLQPLYPHLPIDPVLIYTDNAAVIPLPSASLRDALVRLASL